jgi:hypothetical protein
VSPGSSRSSSAKVPHTPPADLAERTPTWARWPRSRALWHIANSAGPYAVPFAAMRSYGPLPSARFDPHPEPAAESSTERVLYASETLLTALAERFQHNREIRRADPTRPVVYGWFASRVLRLLDLSSAGAVALGASHAISGYRKDVTRRWARALRAAWPDADGLMYASAMTGQSCVALWAPARDSFPSAPAFARGIDLPAAQWQKTLRDAAAELGYTYA